MPLPFKDVTWQHSLRNELNTPPDGAFKKPGLTPQLPRGKIAPMKPSVLSTSAPLQSAVVATPHGIEDKNPKKGSLWSDRAKSEERRKLRMVPDDSLRSPISFNTSFNTSLDKSFDNTYDNNFERSFDKSFVFDTPPGSPENDKIEYVFGPLPADKENASAGDINQARQPTPRPTSDFVADKAADKLAMELLELRMERDGLVGEVRRLEADVTSANKDTRTLLNKVKRGRTSEERLSQLLATSEKKYEKLAGLKDINQVLLDANDTVSPTLILPPPSFPPPSPPHLSSPSLSLYNPHSVHSPNCDRWWLIF
jgi:hypothetical protein